MSNLVLLVPIVSLPNWTHACDMVYHAVSWRSCLFNLLADGESLSNRSPSLSVSPLCIAQLMLQGTHCGWLGDDAPTLQDAREDAMAEYLKSCQWSAKDVEENIQSAGVPRTADGFVDGAQVKQTEYGTIHAVHGFKMDLEAGTLQLDLEYAGRGKPGLLSEKDVEEILGRGIASAIFTLDPPRQHASMIPTDQPESYHPFQEIGYKPAELRGTGMLAAMLDADYLLKFFTTGVEVSGVAPFATRPVASLLSHIKSDETKRVLSPSFERSETNRVHRFWVAPLSIPTQTDISGNTYAEKYGYTPMTVKTQMMKRDSTGNLVDAPVAEQDDNSPEAAFARAFSAHYDQIAKEFPVFARLRELLKLCAVSCVATQLTSKLGEEDVGLEDRLRPGVEQQLRDIKRSVGNFPKADDAYLVAQMTEEHINKCCRQAGVHRSRVSATQVLAVKLQLESALRDADRQNVSMLQDAMRTNFNIYVSLDDISCWLRGTLRTELIASSLCEGVARRLRNEKLQARRRLIDDGVSTSMAKLDGDMHHAVTDASTCSWVPAAFNQQSRHRIYGGVSMIVSRTNARVQQAQAFEKYRVARRQQRAAQYAARQSNAARLDAQRAKQNTFVQKQRATTTLTAQRTAKEALSTVKRSGATASRPAVKVPTEASTSAPVTLSTMTREQRRVASIADPKIGRDQRGWYKTMLDQKGVDGVRAYPGHDMAHARGFEAAKMKKSHDVSRYASYAYTNAVPRQLHRIQHRNDAQGRKNADHTRGDSGYSAYHHANALKNLEHYRRVTNERGDG